MAEPVPRPRSFHKAPNNDTKTAIFQRAIEVAGFGAQVDDSLNQKDLEDEDAITVNEDFEVKGEGEWLMVERSLGKQKEDICLTKQSQMLRDNDHDAFNDPVNTDPMALKIKEPTKTKRQIKMIMPVASAHGNSGSNCTMTYNSVNLKMPSNLQGDGSLRPATLYTPKHAQEVTEPAQLLP